MMISIFIKKCHKYMFVIHQSRMNQIILMRVFKSTQKNMNRIITIIIHINIKCSIIKNNKIFSKNKNNFKFKIPQSISKELKLVIKINSKKLIMKRINNLKRIYNQRIIQINRYQVSQKTLDRNKTIHIINNGKKEIVLLGLLKYLGR